MIYKLQRKFILICTISILTVITVVFGVMTALNISSMNKTLDVLADRVSEGGGKFPSQSGMSHKPGKAPPKKEHEYDFITPETPFATRHFTVFFDGSGNVSETHTEAIVSITEEQAIKYAQKAISSKSERGWISNYRYKTFSAKDSSGVVFIDGSMNRTSMMQSMTISGAVLLTCATLVLILTSLLSKKTVKPIAESYEKQKQFITDANHELKTPLTLILANLDIAESELGKNEWLDDIRSEGNRMAELVNRLVALSRMDEDDQKISFTEVQLGRMVTEAVSEFEPLAAIKNKTFEASIDSAVTCQGDDMLLRNLVGILFDNAIKYCDADGEINVSLSRHRRIVLTVENTYSSVGEIELDRLFDRFYRADKARTYNGGYGIGLSMAKCIVERHGGEISAYKKDNCHIGFKIIL